MILEFKDRHYVDVDHISALRMFETHGIVVVGAEKITVDEDEFAVIEKAYLWQHNGHIYDKDMKKRGK
jgi:hypothetical protein